MKNMPENLHHLFADHYLMIPLRLVQHLAEKYFFLVPFLKFFAIKIIRRRFPWNQLDSKLKIKRILKYQQSKSHFRRQLFI